MQVIALVLVVGVVGTLVGLAFLSWRSERKRLRAADYRRGFDDGWCHALMVVRAQGADAEQLLTRVSVDPPPPGGRQLTPPGADQAPLLPPDEERRESPGR